MRLLIYECNQTVGMRSPLYSRQNNVLAALLVVDAIERGCERRCMSSS